LVTPVLPTQKLYGNSGPVEAMVGAFWCPERGRSQKGGKKKEMILLYFSPRIYDSWAANLQ